MSSVSNYIKNLETMVELAKVGTTDCILKRFPCPANRRMVDDTVKESKAPFAHRNASGWIRKIKGRLVADRLLDVLLKMHQAENTPEGAKAIFNRVMTEHQLLDAYNIYTSMYPLDEITTNRIFFFSGHIRDREVLISRSPCEKCGRPFIVHSRDNFRMCASCTQISQVESGRDTKPKRRRRTQRLKKTG